MSEYIKGDYTRCYEDICEIWYEDNLYCIVRTCDADKLIDVLNENEQLKQRNNRQYEQLDRLYNLIEQKDWRALNDILDDFKRCEKQLQREWGAYGDVE